jgi:hypothetical protein
VSDERDAELEALRAELLRVKNEASEQVAVVEFKLVTLRAAVEAVLRHADGESMGNWRAIRALRRAWEATK